MTYIDSLGLKDRVAEWCKTWQEESLQAALAD
jgi:hypothetical protein